MDFYKWFFLEEGRTPEGLFSFAHLFSVTITLIAFLTLAYFLGKKFRNNPKAQTIILMVAGISIVLVEAAKIAYCAATSTDSFWSVLFGLFPLYFCDVPIYIIPLAAFTRGRFRTWCIDFMAICGLLMGFMGNYFAGNIYGSSCAISFFAVNSLLNHSISAFVAFFIFVAKMYKFEKRDIPFVVGILFTFMTIALVVDYIWKRNFMFFFNGDGTPFTLFLNLFGGALIPYQITIYVLQCGYIGLFYGVFYWIMSSLKKREEHKKLQAQDSTSSN